MQLNKSASIREGLARATYTLLSSTAVVAHAESQDGVKTDAGALFYNETGRVHIFEPVMQAQFVLGDDETLSLRGVLDIMSGASPSGAAVSTVRQVFTSPSGGATHNTPAYQLPTQEFSDQRLALSVDWDRAVSATQKNLLGGSFSIENDYTSFGISDTLRTDFNDKLTTLSTGISANLDSVNPISGAPTPLSQFSAKPLSNKSDDSREKAEDGITTRASGGGEGEDDGKLKGNVTALIGITQVINRRLLMQFNYSLSATAGYMNDPYKIVSVIDRNTGLPLTYINPNDGSTATDAVTEGRPDRKLANTLYWKGVLHLPSDVIHASYRYYRDSWGVRAHTADLAYRLELWGSHYLRPSIRYHVQTAADFYRTSLIDGDPLPKFASADYRLAAMTSYTVGLRYGFRMGANSQFGLRVERMLQTGEHYPTSAVGAQKQVDLYPNLEAYTVLLELNTVF